ncbi:MAG: DUF411 domain-containing protein [Anaerolineales bacterium]|nr:DUF411 domain-containing protein [Anaerolineales bacterium]
MVDLVDLGDQELRDLKADLGVADEFASCHTALVDGYIIEGHVPADLIEKLLRETPDLVGLVVPGMPPGSPGMGSSQGGPYEVFALDKDGRTWVYDRR